MAATLKLLSLIFLISSLSSITQARDSQFFSKEVRYNTPKETQPTETNPKEKPDPSPTATKQEEQPTQVTPESESHNGYGLYSHETQEYPSTEYYTSNKFSGAGTGTGGFTTGYPTKEYENGEFSEKYPTKEYENAKFSEKYPTKEYENAQFTEKYPTKEYETLGTSDTYPTKEYETGEPTERYNSKEFEAKGSTTNYPTREQYGMSDTRLLENGRYFYDVNSEGRRNVYGSTDEVEPSGTYRGDGYYGRRQNGYESNNYKGGYENSRQEEQEEEYVP